MTRPLIPVADSHATPHWGVTPDPTARPPGRHSNSLSLTPETNEAPQGVR
jgi:hypothetical protein